MLPALDRTAWDDFDSLGWQDRAAAGMGHAWPGPEGHGLFTGLAGLAASALLWGSPSAHPMPR